MIREQVAAILNADFSMILANLMISVYVLPLFELMASLKAFFLVVAIETAAIQYLTKPKLLPLCFFVTAANLISTAVGLGMVWILPSNWHVATDISSMRDWRIPALCVGYVLCFIFSAAIELAFYRIPAIRNRTTIPQRATFISNGLSYVAAPLVMWIYGYFWRLYHLGPGY